MRKTMLSLIVMFATGLIVAAQQGAVTKPAAATPMAAKGAMNAQAKIAQAMSAAPADISKNATIMDFPDTPTGAMKELRKGTNGWTCMPSSPGEYGGASIEDPMCLDGAFMGWAGAWMSKKDPQVTTVGVGYMLKGDKGASNTDPFASGPTADNHWVVSPAHVMVVVPNPAMLDTVSTDPNNGGPWVMWKGTKYAHIMVPVAPMPKAKPMAAPKP